MFSLVICNYDFIIEGVGHQYAPMLLLALMWLTEILAKCLKAGARGSVVLAAYWWRAPPPCTAGQQRPTAN